MSDTTKWGRVLICGGTDWPKLGRKERPGKTEPSHIEPPPDLLSPHILRSLADISAVSAHTSSSGCHFIVIDTEGAAWIFGRNGSAALGIPSTKLEYISENAPRKVTVQSLGGAPEATFVHAGAGRNHTLLVTSEGEVWTAGNNALGQCGHSPSPEVSLFTRIEPKWFGEEKPIQAAAGVTFSLVLTEAGKVFSFGSAEKGQLGNGTTGERITTGNKSAFDIEHEPYLIREFNGKVIKQVACGQQHAIALDDAGIVYVWGYNGYCRLGLGDQKDILKPKAVPNFLEKNETTRAAFVDAGPHNSVVVDKQEMYWMAGKWKNTGDGSSGSPYTTFRVMQDIMACKALSTSCGGVTHWVVTPDDVPGSEGVMTVCWGQNAANGELGMGEEEPKSSTKPGKNVPLNGIDVLSVAAGQNTTLIIARPSTSVEDNWNDLARHPEEVQPADACLGCSQVKGDDVTVLECEKCESPFHLECLNPPLTSVPEGEWFCQYCTQSPGAALQGYEVDYKKLLVKAPRPAKGADDDEGAGGKRKAANGKGQGAAPKKKK